MDGDQVSAPESRAARRRIVAGAAVALAAVGGLYVGLPAVAGLDDTWRRVGRGDPAWLALGAVLELCSFAGYVVLVRAVLVRGEPRFGWRESTELTLAGLAATRLLAAGGAGGIALTAWAMRAAGMASGRVVVRLTSFLVLLYGVFMGALVVGGLALVLGAPPAHAPAALSIVPALFGLGVIVAALSLSLSRLGRPAPPPEDDDPAVVRRVARRLDRVARLIAAGVRDALAVARSRDPGLLGALAWWGFDIAVLWACFRAFGDPPPVAALVMAYFVGMFANTLPLPGGIGGVDVGMVGAFVGFDVNASLAIVAVLAYRFFAFWLPTVPGALAYIRLRSDVGQWRAVGRADSG